MRRFLLPVALGFCLVASAQKKNTPAWYANTITAADMKKHLFIIAGPEMEGRNTPSPGLERAADYIENHFRNLGLAPSSNGTYRQQFPLYRDSVTSSALKVNGSAFELNNDFQPNANTNHTAEFRFSEAVFVGYGIVDGAIDDYREVDVKGKLVLLLDGAPASYKPSQPGRNAASGIFAKLRNAQAKGAAAVLVVYGNFPRKTFSSTSNYSLNGYAASIMPQTFFISEKVAAGIMGADGQDILNKMKSSALASKAYKANIDLGFTKTTSVSYASNVLGILEGTDKKDEYVVITAHYDHEGKRTDGTIFYGADDDGSGTTTVLELAEAFAQAKKAGKGPRRSIIFMTVAGEEKGLWGSWYYAHNPLYPLDKTTVNLNIDMVGRVGEEYQNNAKDSANYVYIIGDDKLSTDLAVITDKVNKTMKMVLDRKYNDPNDKNRFYYRSDHYNFAEQGVPVIFYFNGVHADYHRPTDTPDKINYPLMAKRGQLIYHTALEIANRDEMLKRDLKLEMPPR